MVSSMSGIPRLLLPRQCQGGLRLQDNFRDGGRCVLIGSYTWEVCIESCFTIQVFLDGLH